MKPSLTEADLRAADPRRHLWLAFASGTVLTHFMVVLLAPRLAIQRQSSSYWFLIGAALFYYVLPFAWSIFLLFIYRGWRERLVSYLSLASSTLWLLAAQQLIFEILLRFLKYGR